MTTPNFKNTKFYFANKQEAEAIQKAMFKLGFCWCDHKPYQQRKLEDIPYADGFIYVDKDCRMMYSAKDYGFHMVDYRSAFVVALFDAATSKQRADRAKRKASRKKKAADNFTPWDGKQSICPIPSGTKFIAKFRNPHPDRAGHVATAPAYRWNHYLEGLASDYDIIGYKIIEQAKNPRNLRKSLTKEESMVTLEGMVATIVKDAGGVEVTPHDSEGYILWSGGEMPVPKGAKVDVKFRAGEDKYGLIAGTEEDGRCANDRFWVNDLHGSDIVAYRLSKPKLELVPMEPRPVAEAAPDTNPKRQYGVQSIPLSYWSPLASAYGALGLYNGALKYGKANFANTKVEASIYIDAAMRHLSAWAQGEEFDPKDNVPNLGGVLANVAILLEARAAGTLIDDRALWSGYLRERDDLTVIVKGLNILHADKSPKHYTRETV